MKSQQKQKRNRLIALSFVSVLLLLVYGPLAQWFVAADRMLYDQLAGHLPNKPLENAFIVSIDPSRSSPEEVLDTYGRILVELNDIPVRRIIMAQPPEVAASDSLPGWSAVMSTGVPVYTPTRHRFADFAKRAGFVDISAESDGILRRSELWQLNDGVMSPSLPLAIAFDNEDAVTSHRMSSEEDAIFVSNYVELPRIAVADLLNESADKSSLRGATVFVDAAPALVAASATLPSRQFVTVTEAVAAMLADVEQDTTIIAPSWVAALQWLAPVLLAIFAVLFMPDRSRKDIAVLAGATIVMLLLLEALLLYVLHVRLDLGRAIVIFAGAAILSAWLVGDAKKEVQDAEAS